MTAALAQIEFDWSQWFVPLTGQWWQETTCSVLVGIACGVLGCFVVLRRMALIGDALSHAVLPGVVIAFLVTGSAGIVGLLVGALLAGLITAGMIKLVSQYSRTKEDSAIGIVFTAFFAVGIILISGMGRGTHFDLKCFLFGDPLAVGRDDLIMMSFVAPTVLLIVFVLYHRLKLVSFDPVVAATMGISVTALHYLLMGMLSATVVAGLKTTGVILVVAMIITPASAAYQLTDRLWSMLILAGLFGALSACAGMSVAFITNCPTGPAMVLVATLIFAATVVLSPKHGWLVRVWRRRRLRRHVDGEDILKAVYHIMLMDERPCTLSAVTAQTDLAPRRLASGMKDLVHTRCLRLTGDAIDFTADGRSRATGLVRAHRLWETYLADEVGVDTNSVHGEAERLEHAHELADEVDVSLGHPRRDPHGTLIPSGQANSSEG